MNAPILIVGPVEPPIGGVSRYCRSLVDLLRREGATAIPIDPAHRTGAGGFLRRLLLLPARRAMGPGTLEVARAARRHSAALVLDNHPLLWRNAAYARGVRWCVTAPYALVLHDGAFPGFVEALGAGASRRLSRGLERLAGVVCMSDPILEAVRRLAPAARVHRLDPMLMDPVPAGMGGPSTRLPGDLADFFNGSGPVICASGALDPLYGIEDLLEAFGRLRAGGSDARLVLILGSFAQDRATSAAVAKAKARWGEGAIRALLDLPEGAIVIAHSSVYVRPSRVDSFGLALHEALLAGVPAVAAQHPARPEGVLTYPPGDSGALALAIQKALAPESKAAAVAQTPRFREAVEKNRIKTLATLAALSAPAAGTGARCRVPRRLRSFSGS